MGLPELLDDGDKLKIQWENSINIPFVGWTNLEIQLEGSDMTLSNVPFLVMSDYMERTILGFNMIKETLQDSQLKDALVTILTKSFGKSLKVQDIFKSMQQESRAEPVYIKKWMKVPVNIIMVMSCKANLGILAHRMPVVSTRHTDCLPEGISVPVLLVVFKSGAANKINVLVVNETSHNILLAKNKYLGKVEIIKSIT